jgi:tetratricopeptide (TPR) repeat protein/O-antigen ligase
MSLTLFFDKLNKIPLYLFLFLIPIFFLPFGSDVLDFPKQILASILIPLSLIGWLGKGICAGKLILRGHKIFYFSLILIFLSLLLSSVFSILGDISFFGYLSDITDSFLTFLLFLILTFLFINSFQTEAEFPPFLFFLLLSGAVAGIFNLLQIYKIFVLPFDFAKNYSFNTIGTPNSFAILGAVFLPISLILAFSSKGYLRIILGLTSFIFFANVVLTNFKTAWVALMICILVLFVFGFGKEKKIKVSFALLLMTGLIFSLFFYFFPLSLPGFPVLSPEVFLSSHSEIVILKGVFGEGIKNLILGTGPGTFIFDYSKYHSPLLNQTLFWGTRFANGNSSFFDWLSTKGVFGGASLLFFYLLIIYSVLKELSKNKAQNFIGIKLGLSSGILGLICASFFYSFNFTLYFAFWFLASLLLFFFSSKATEINLGSRSRTILANGILMLIIIFTLGLNFFQGQKYLAEMKYLKGIEAFRAGDVEKAINYLQQATGLNPSLDIYWRDLSQLFLTKTNLISQNANLPSEEKRRLTNSAIVNGAEAINQAINILPVNVANWNVRGFFYRNLVGVEGAGDLSLASYQKAIDLEPTSPFAYGEKGRVHILMAQDFSQKGKEDLAKENLDLALESLKTAVNLKPDYAPAHYLLAVVYDQQGKMEEAISKLEETQIITPQDSGVAFQLGLLYWRKEKTKEARQQFEKAVILNADYSNARYMLGLAYDKDGEKEKAKKEFEKLITLNPQNEQLRKILENIEKGLPALEGVISSQPPLPELPFEIQESQP